MGFMCFGATLPAAGMLGIRSIRSRRVGDGSDLAVGVLVLGVSWISFMFVLPIVRSIALTASAAHDDLRIIAFVLGWVALATIATSLANRLLTIHPERYVASAAARAGIVMIAAAGFLQTARVTSGAHVVSEPCGATNADCLGALPWASIVPALIVGTAWFVGSLLIAHLGTTYGRRRGPLRA